MTPSPTCELSGAQADGNLTARMSAKLEKLCAISCSKTRRVLSRKKERGRGHYAPLVGLMNSSVNLYLGHRRHEMEHFCFRNWVLELFLARLTVPPRSSGFHGGASSVDEGFCFQRRYPERSSLIELGTSRPTVPHGAAGNIDEDF